MHDSSFGYLFFSIYHLLVSQQLYVLQHSGTCLLIVVLVAGLDKDCRLTEPLGMRIAEFPLNPMFAKMLLESGGWRPTVLIDFILTFRGVISVNSLHPGVVKELLPNAPRFGACC